MARNRGATTLKCRRVRRDPMRDYDRLPAELRAWLAGAILPWRPRSALIAFEKARARLGDANLALRELDRIEAAMVSKDARRIWGESHPFARQAGASAKRRDTC